MENSVELKQTAYKKAGFWTRFGARIVDSLIFFILLKLLLISSQHSNQAENLLYYVIDSLLSALFIWKKGATPGKMFLKIKVVSTTYTPISFWRALFRESIGKSISGALFFLGYLWMLIDKRGQTWHDMLAKTFVVKLDEAGSLQPSEIDETVTKKSKALFWVILLCNPFTLAFIFLIIYILLFRPFQVSGDSMTPSFKPGEYFMTTMRPQTLSRGDVIVYKATTEKDFVKRIIALPGDTIMLKDGDVYLNGTKLNESSYLPNDIKTYGGAFMHDDQTLTVPQDSYVVLGDNRPYSSDTRETGFVTKNAIISKTSFCYWNCK